MEVDRLNNEKIAMLKVSGLPRLKALAAAGKKPKFVEHDGQGLYAQFSLGIHDRVCVSWLHRYRNKAGVTRTAGLGNHLDVTLKAARLKRIAQRDELLAGNDPLATKPAPAKTSSPNLPTFAMAAESFISAHEAGWAVRSAAGWRQVVRDHCKPIASMRIDLIDDDAVLNVLKPIWTQRPRLGEKIRSKIERILSAAKRAASRQGLTTGPLDVAKWKKGMEHDLPAPGKIKKVEHHAAVPVAEMPAFMAGLASAGRTPPHALIQFIALTGVRLGAACSARWDEIDGDVWTIGNQGTKGAAGLRIPLPRQVVDLLKRTAPTSPWIFCAGGNIGANQQIVRRAFMKLRPDASLHGFRSTLRDWCGDETDAPRELAESALGHAVGNAVEQAYRRGDALAKRRALMQAWADYLLPGAGA